MVLYVQMFFIRALILLTGYTVFTGVLSDVPLFVVPS
jgi:hypothetical protein